MSSSQHTKTSDASRALSPERASDAACASRVQALRQLANSLPGFYLPEAALDAARWVVGLSGGVDSTVLLDALARVPQSPEIIALYVHHGLSDHADDWLAHCEAVCQRLGVALVSEHVHIETSGHGSVERAARGARYAAFAKHAKANDVIFLGHHQDDQAETVLFRLLRGTGVNGLGAMRTMATRQIEKAELTLCRPLLDCSQAAISAYAQAQDLRWVDDESNHNTRFARNFLRQDVLPLIEMRWPQAREKLAQTAQLAQAQQEIVDDWSDAQLERCVVTDKPSMTGCVFDATSMLTCAGAVAPLLSVNLLQEYTQPQLALIVQRWAGLAGETLQFHQHQAVFDAVHAKATAFELVLSHSVLRIFQSQLFLLDKAFYQSIQFKRQSTSDLEGLSSDTVTLNQLPLSMHPSQSTPWFGGAVSLESACEMTVTLLDARKLEGKNLTLRLRQSTLEAVLEAKNPAVNSPAGVAHSERMRIAHRGTRAIKRLLQDVSLLPWLRPVVPLLYADDELIAVAGCAVAADYSADDETLQSGHALYFHWQALGQKLTTS